MKISKQGVLGASMLIGGSIMLFAITQQPEPANKAEKTPTEAQVPAEVDLVEVTEDNQELTTDIETEKKILEEKQQERENLVKSQEEKSQAFIEEQEKAAEQAIDKTQQEMEAFNKAEEAKKADVTTETKAEAKSEEKAETKAEAKSEPKAEEKTEVKAETKPVEKAETKAEAKPQEKVEVKAEPVKKAEKPVKKSPTSYIVKNGDSMSTIAKKHNLSLAVLSEANDMHSSGNIMAGQKLAIPTQAEVNKLKKSAKHKQAVRLAKIQAKQQQAKRKAEAVAKAKAEAKRKAELKAKQAEQAKAKKAEQAKQAKAKKAEQEKAKQAKKAEPKQAKATDKAVQGTFGVQITLASNQAEADKVANRLRKAGYKVKTSKTDRGVRVMVGPQRGKKEALALKDKINKDPRVKVKDAWVLFWR